MNNELKTVQCGCGGEAEIFHIAPEGYEGSYCVRCMECLTQTPFFNKDKDKAIEVWNRAMGAKDINVPNKFVTDTNVGNKTAKFKQDGEFLRCGKCNHIVDSGYKYCPKCGSRLEFE